MLRTIERDTATGGGVLAGAVAFRIFMFMVPFVFLLVGVFGLGSSAADQDPQTLAKKAGITGIVAKSLSSVGDLSLTERILYVVVIGFATFLATRALLKVLRIVHALVWHVRAGKFERPARASLALVGIVLLAIVLSALVGVLRGQSFLLGLFASVFVHRDPGRAVGVRVVAPAARRRPLDRVDPRRRAVRRRARGDAPRDRVLDRPLCGEQDGDVRRHRLRHRLAVVGVPDRAPDHHVHGGERVVVDAQPGAARARRRQAGTTTGRPRRAAPYRTSRKSRTTSGAWPSSPGPSGAFLATAFLAGAALRAGAAFLAGAFLATAFLAGAALRAGAAFLAGAFFAGAVLPVSTASLNAFSGVMRARRDALMRIASPVAGCGPCGRGGRHGRTSRSR